MDIIFYFTGTGNSLNITRKLADRIPGMESKRILKTMRAGYDVKGYDSIGIVFPVYFSGIPHMVREFIRNMSVSEGTYIYGVANYGDQADIAVKQFQQDLSANRSLDGIGLMSFFGLRMPGNYQLLFDLDPKSKIEADMTALPVSVDTIASYVKERKQMEIEKTSLPTTIKGQLIYGLFKPEKADRKFKVTDECISCGICAKVCPAFNIIIEADTKRPKWNGGCEQCLACFHTCPKKAIHTGGRTLERGRYLNGEITVKELMVDG